MDDEQPTCSICGEYIFKLDSQHLDEYQSKHGHHWKCTDTYKDLVGWYKYE